MMAKQEENRPADDIYEVSKRAGSGELGLRDRHRLDKLRRISTATCLLFAEHGYEGTTLREIAKKADVALGTLSLYAEDKRDLIVMLFNQLIPPLMDKAAEMIDEQGTLVDNMLGYFTPFYHAYAQDVTLYRIILGQIFNHPTSIHAREHGRIRVRITAAMTGIIEQARVSGEIGKDGDLDLQARSFFYIYFGAVRLWLAGENPAPGDGIADLRMMFEQHVRGLARCSEAPAARKGRRRLSV